MNESPTRLARWDETDLVAPLTLDAVAAGHFRNRHGDANLNGRSYGGQSLGQAPIAAASTVAPDRVATMMQLLFLQGTVPDEPIDFAVATLQDGKRFSSRQVRGTQQGGRAVFDAQVSFAVASPAPEHAAPVTPLEATPEDLRPLPSAAWPWETDLRRLGGYSLREKPCMDSRVPDIEPQVAPGAAQARLRFWLKARRALPPQPHLHAAALAYLSDWWLNFSSLGLHVRELGAQQRLYISSLNHCPWSHRPFAAGQWMHVDSESPCAAEGRGLSVARIHDRHGRLVASATQECLMAFAQRRFTPARRASARRCRPAPRAS